MNALTISQPYAALIAAGAKRIETRNWRTAYRGRIAIHAAVGLRAVGGARGLNALVAAEPRISAALMAAGYPCAATLPRGYIVATATLIDCAYVAAHPVRGWVHATGPARDRYEEWQLDDNERAFGDYTPGRYAWLLADIQPLDKALACRGALGLWAVPPEVAVALN